MMHMLALKRAEPDQLKALYQAGGSLKASKAQKSSKNETKLQLQLHVQVMYGYYGLGFDRSLAQSQAIQLAQAGADASVFKETYQATLQKGQREALIEASKAAVAKNLEGLVRRYALDTKPYTASEFQAWKLFGFKHITTATTISRHFYRGTTIGILLFDKFAL